MRAGHPNVILTNYQFYADAFALISRERILGQEVYEYSEPGDRYRLDGHIARITCSV